MITIANQASAHADPVAYVILWVTVIFLLGVVGRYIAMRFKQPGVVGELLMGVLVGNLCYAFGMPLAVILREGAAVFTIMRDLLMGNSLVDAVHASVGNPYYAGQVLAVLQGANGFDLIKVAYIVDIFSRYGVIFLLFMVGLESSFEELKQTGKEALRVAFLGVAAPIGLGLLVMMLLLPSASFNTDLFVAATLCATSIGITARVLTELKKLKTREAQTILGAAMIDDILGLIILAIVSSLVIDGAVSMLNISQVVITSLCFFAGVLWLGPWCLRKAVQAFGFLQPWEAKLSISFIFVMSLSWLATTIGLASIIGAFAAGMIIHDGFFDTKFPGESKALSIKVLVAPLEALMAPLFFMLIGIGVKLEAFFDWQVILVAAGLLVVAIIGKLVSGFGGNRKDDRFLIGIGMLPRGEVGLVFASIGRGLGVISDQLFSAIILMIIMTTLLAPIWLKARYKAKLSKSS